MIYSLPQDSFPKEGQYREIVELADKSGNQWVIARVMNGFFIRQLTETPEACKVIQLTSSSGKKPVLIRNYNCIFFQIVEFEPYAEVRDMILNHTTAEIWVHLHTLFAYRLQRLPRLLVCEVVSDAA